MFRENRTQTNLLIGALVLAVVLIAPWVAVARENPQHDIERIIRDFVVAFSQRDFAVFVPYFSEDATVFFPPSAAAPLGRVQGRSQIERTFKTIFDAYPPRSTRPTSPIAPQDLLIQEFEGYAVVTFHLGSDGTTAAHVRFETGRRRLEIVHLHGSAVGGQP